MEKVKDDIKALQNNGILHTTPIVVAVPRVEYTRAADNTLGVAFDDDNDDDDDDDDDSGGHECSTKVTGLVKHVVCVVLKNSIHFKFSSKDAELHDSITSVLERLSTFGKRRYSF